jgi:hypothetical protein
VNAHALEPGDGVIATIWIIRISMLFLAGLLITAAAALISRARRRIRRTRLAHARACDRARGTQARETPEPTRQYECPPPTDPKE